MSFTYRTCVMTAFGLFQIVFFSACEPGTYSLGSGSLKCESCPPGMFQDLHGQQNCKGMGITEHYLFYED